MAYEGATAVHGRIYDLAGSRTLNDELAPYSAIVDSNDVLHAFCCVDSAARVPGLSPTLGFSTSASGLDPYLVGKVAEPSSTASSWEI